MSFKFQFSNSNKTVTVVSFLSFSRVPIFTHVTKTSQFSHCTFNYPSFALHFELCPIRTLQLEQIHECTLLFTAFIILLIILFYFIFPNVLAFIQWIQKIVTVQPRANGSTAFKERILIYERILMSSNKKSNRHI